MTANRIEITLSDERLAALDQARGHEPRASFIKRWTDRGIAEGRSVPYSCEDEGHRFMAGSPRCKECGYPYDGSATDTLLMSPNEKAGLSAALSDIEAVLPEGTHVEADTTPILGKLIDTSTGKETPVRQGPAYDSGPISFNVSAKPAVKPRPKGKR